MTDPTTGRRSAATLDDLLRLNELGSRLWRAPGVREGLEEMLDAVLELLGTQMGSVQLVDAASGRLRFMAQRGFAQEFLDCFGEVSESDTTTCGRALHRRERVVVEDVEADEPFAPHRPAARAAGFRAVQSTPLLGRAGEPLGMLNTHFPTVHRPSDTDLARVDLYARLAVDFLERWQGEEALRASERRFRDMADAAPVLVWMTGPDRGSTWFNQPWLDFVGRPLERELGLGWTESVHPDDLAACVRTFGECFTARSAFTMEYRLRRHDGEYRWMLDHGTPLYEGGGRFGGYIGTSVDITERKHAERAAQFLARASAALAELTDEETTLRRVAEQAVPFYAGWCAVDLLDEDGTVRRVAVAHVDPAKVRLARELQIKYPTDLAAPRGLGHVLGTGRAELYETVTDELIDAAARGDEHRALLRALGIESAMCVPLVARDRVLGALSFVSAGGGVHYRADDLRAAEDLAQRTVIALENARLYRALQETDRRKDEFIAILAHELRNPLAPVRNASHYLKLRNLGDPELERPIAMIDRQVHLLSRLIDDLLDVSRLSRGTLALKRERVQLSEAVEAAIDACRHEVDARRHLLHVEVPETAIVLDADRPRLVQVLCNLLINAAKYSPPGGRIDLSARVEGASLVLSVRDQGIGIPADKLGEIFDLFAQVDRSLERQGGLGVGLTLARQLVELHGGTIEARSEGAGRGSEFIVELPVLVPALASSGDASGEPSGPVRRVLVVDDNPDSVESLALVLEIARHKVHRAYDGLAALESAERLAPDVVLLDIGMPRMNGFEVARRMRAAAWGRDLHLVALTGWGQDDDKRRSREAGFDAHLVKPVDPRALVRLLADLPPVRARSGAAPAGAGFAPPVLRE